MEKKKNPGKQFEKDFQESALRVMSFDRLNDPGGSFNTECNNCPKKKTRFSPRHLCDAIGYSYPNIFYFELKSVKGKSIPFKNIVKSKKDTRLEKMAAKNLIEGARSFIVVNFREEDNHTYAVSAKTVLNYIKTEQRKSIPMEFCRLAGYEIHSKIKKVHYNYDVKKFLNDLRPF